MKLKYDNLIAEFVSKVIGKNKRIDKAKFVEKTIEKAKWILLPEELRIKLGVYDNMEHKCKDNHDDEEVEKG